MPAASATADPPEEPPGVHAGFHGFRVTPQKIAPRHPDEIELRRGRLNMQDRACFQQLVDDRMIVVSHVIFVQHAPFRDDPPGPVIFVLDRDGYALEQTRIAAPVACPGLFRGSDCFIEMPEGDRVVMAIGRLDACDLRLQNIEGRQFSRLEKAQLFMRRHEANTIGRRAGSRIRQQRHAF
jgi:hypothetical protein